ncbi:hypothetical protein R5R35_011345 [Gryllus longicercus]|uniref:Uncharacterized protein n=1 Tax=Gryllus longicercus TaxID=2509291 RepID=A0AAN9WNK4_9ORTH
MPTHLLQINIPKHRALLFSRCVNADSPPVRARSSESPAAARRPGAPSCAVQSRAGRRLSHPIRHTSRRHQAARFVTLSQTSRRPTLSGRCTALEAFVGCFHSFSFLT